MRRPRTLLVFAAAFIAAVPSGPAAAATLQAPSDSVAAEPYPLPPDAYRVYTGQGAGSSLDEVVEAARSSEVLFLGEMHDDRVGHAIQHELFRHLIDSVATDDSTARPPGARSAGRTVLSLEMFERDVQHVLDEYLSGLITEDHLLKSARPWPFYEDDYRPLVELARERGLRVVAANAPRRYVNRVTREGPASLDALGPEAKATLPPLPYAPPSAAYRERLEEAMAPHRAPSGTEARDTTIVPRYGAEAQALWDATMAYSIVESLVRDPEALAVHLVGSFHISWGLGLLEHLQRYRPGTRTLTVVVRPVQDPAIFPDSLRGLADIVVLTDSAHVRPRATPSATGLGAYPVAPWEVPRALLVGGVSGDVLRVVRFPRVALGLVVGGGLALAGGGDRHTGRSTDRAPNRRSLRHRVSHLDTSSGLSVGSALPAAERWNRS